MKKPKSFLHTMIRQEKNKNDKQITEIHFPKKIKISLKKNSKTKKINQSIKDRKIKQKYNNNALNIEDSSTNCFSGNIKKNIIPKFDYNLKNKQKDNPIIPLLIPRESDTESLFINFKLGEKDSYTDSTLRSDLKDYDNNNNNKNENNNKNRGKSNDSKKKINIKKYNHCEVDGNIGQNENDSLEIYDFTDKTNVDYVLKNLSALSCSKSGKDLSSIILDDFNEEDKSGNKKIINKIKIFNTKQSLSNICSKIKFNNNDKDLKNNKNNMIIKHNCK